MLVKPLLSLSVNKPGVNPSGEYKLYQLPEPLYNVPSVSIRSRSSWVGTNSIPYLLSPKSNVKEIRVASGNPLYIKSEAIPESKIYFLRSVSLNPGRGSCIQALRNLNSSRKLLFPDPLAPISTLRFVRGRAFNSRIDLNPWTDKESNLAILLFPFSSNPTILNPPLQLRDRVVSDASNLQHIPHK